MNNSLFGLKHNYEKLTTGRRTTGSQLAGFDPGKQWFRLVNRKPILTDLGLSDCSDVAIDLSVSNQSAMKISVECDRPDVGTSTAFV